MKANESQLKKQLAALISAVRPSILWRVDGQTAPLDLLDDDGITGWQIGLGSIIAEFGDPSTTGFNHVLDWIQRDRELEKSRWLNPHVTLTQARIVLSSKAWQLSPDQVVIDQWVRNIEAAFVRSPNSLEAPRRSSQTQAAQLVDIFRQLDGTSAISSQLEQLAGIKPSAEEPRYRTDNNGLIALSDLKRLQSWLEIPSVAKPPLQDQTQRKSQLAS